MIVKAGSTIGDSSISVPKNHRNNRNTSQSQQGPRPSGRVGTASLSRTNNQYDNNMKQLLQNQPSGGEAKGPLSYQGRGGKEDDGTSSAMHVRIVNGYPQMTPVPNDSLSATRSQLRKIDNRVAQLGRRNQSLPYSI